ncbi:MAG: LysR family transcriptional regulator [Rhodobacteraceae bacterium]|nr:LysR family transcriptional regulator [Paracoccaceae bacterium]
MFDWDDLRFLLAVARHGSTLSAARALGVSQPTVQRRLTALEERIGATLVERHPTGYRLSELGRTMLPFAEDIERSFLAFERKLMSGGEELSGTLRVTCPEGTASRLLAPLIESFRARYPELGVELIMTDRRLDLARGEAEVAVRMYEPGEDSLVARKIADSRWMIYASRSYIERRGEPQQLADLDCHSVVEFGGELADSHAARWLRRVAPEAIVAARGNSMLGVLAAVKSGVGLAPLPILLGGSEADLRPMLEPVPDLDTRIYLVMHPDLRRTARVRAFCDFVAAEIGRFRPLLIGGD